MSDTPRVGIEVAVDASSAESGLGRIDAAVSRTGRTLDSLGERGGAALGSVGAQSAAAAGQMDASTRSIISQIQRQIATMEAGERGTRSYYESITRIRGGNADVLRPYLDQLDQVSARQAAARTGLNATAGSLGQVGVSARQTAAAMRGVPAQITDIVTSLQGGQAPLTVFLQQGGQLRDMFGGAGAAARALSSTLLGMISPLTIGAAAAIALGVAYNQGSKEADAYNRALIMTGNAAGTTAGQLADMARGISQSVGTQGEAAEAVAALAGTGAVAAANMQQFGEIAVRAQKTIGISVEDTAKAFADLAKNPLAASEKLNDQYRYLTAAVYEQIKALEQQGRTEEAGEVAQRAYADAMAERTRAITSNLGSVERAWESVKGVAKGAWDSMLNIGREDTLEEKLADVAAKIAKAQKKTYSFIDGPDARAEIERLRTEQALLQSQQREQTKANEQKATANKLEQAGIEWSKEYTKYLDKETQKKNELAYATNRAKAANVDLNSQQFKTVVKGIEDKYEDKAAIAAAKKQAEERNNLAKAALEAQRAVEKEMSAGTLANLESQHKQALISDAAYYAAKRDLQLKDLDAEAALLQKQAERAGKKSDKTEQDKYLGELKVLEQRRVNIVQAAQNAIDETVTASTKALADQSRAWRDASAEEAAQLREELSLFGTNAEARKIATAQLKVESDARQFIAAQEKANRPLSQQQIADLQAEVRERQKNIAAIMGERQALAGAEQLKSENKRFAAEYIVDERARAAALLEIDAQVWRDRIALAAEGSEARKLLETEFAEWYRNQSIKPQLDAQRELWRNIESTAHDTFVSIFDSGKSAFDRLRDTLKNGLAELLYQMTIKKWILNIQANVGSSGGLSGIADAISGTSGGGSGGSLLGSASNLFSIGKAIYSGFSGGLASSMGTMITNMGTTFGSAAVAEFGAGMSGVAGTGLASGSAAGMGASAASAIPVIGWIIAGMNMSNSLYKQGWDFNNGSVNKLGQNLGSGINLFDQALRKIGLSNTAANIFSGLAPVSRLFGRRNPTIEEQGIRGAVSAAGFSGEQYANILEKGGYFRSDKRYTNTATLPTEQDKGFDDTIVSMIAAVKGFGSALGLETSAIDGYNKQIKLVLTNDEAKNKEAIASMFAGIGDELSTMLLPSVKQFAKEGETASATLQRVASDFTNVTTLMQSIGVEAAKAFGTVGVASLEARERLITVAGGIDSLASQTSFFAQNFLTKAEQVSPTQKALAEQMAALGYAGVTTADQFKAAVLALANSGTLATEAGAKTYAGLLAIAPQFKAVADYMQEIANTKAADALAALRDQATLLQSAVDAAMSSLQRSVSAQRNSVTSAYEAGMVALDASIQGVTLSIQKATSLSGLLKSTLSGMTVQGQESATRAAATAQIQAALAIAKAGGVLPDADSLRDALAAASKVNVNDYSTQEDYQREVARTAAAISELSGITGTKLTAEQQQLKLLEEQKDAAKKAYEAEIARLDGILENAQKQLDVLNGVSAGVQAIPAALSALAAAIAAASKNPVVAAPSLAQGAYNQYLARDASKAEIEHWTGQADAGVDIVGAIVSSDEAYIQSLYRDLLGRDGEAAGVDSWEESLRLGLTRDQIRDGFLASEEYKRLHPFAVGTNYVPETMPALVHEGERIIPAADNRALMQALNRPARHDDAALLAEIRALREEVAALRTSAAQTAQNTGKTSDLLNTVSAGGNAFAVEVMPE